MSIDIMAALLFTGFGYVLGALSVWLAHAKKT